MGHLVTSDVACLNPGAEICQQVALNVGRVKTWS